MRSELGWGNSPCIRHRQDEERSTVKGGERRFNEAFAPRCTNRQLLIEGLPAYPDLGTTTLVSLFLNSSKRPEALNSNEYAPECPSWGW
jgi:hypothetical protein